MSVIPFIVSLPYWNWVIFGYFQFRMSYLFQVFNRHSWDVSALVQNNFRFFVCLSVCSLPNFLTEIGLSYDISSSGWDIFQIFLKYSLDVCTLALNNFRFLVCLSVYSLPHFLTEIVLSSSRWATFFKFSAEISGIPVH